MKNDWDNFKLGRINHRKLVGFSKKMLWNFDITLAIFLRDSLTAYKEYGHGIPGTIYDKYDGDESLSKEEKDAKALTEWHKILNDMIAGFNAYAKIEEVQGVEYEANYKAFSKAFKLLGKWWGHLWD